MNDNIVTIGTGSITSMTTGVIINITLLGIWEVALYGFIGASVGLLAKILIKWIISLTKNKQNE
jgi:hypothetical protein